MTRKIHHICQHPRQSIPDIQILCYVDMSRKPKSVYLKSFPVRQKTMYQKVDFRNSSMRKRGKLLQQFFSLVNYLLNT